MRVQILDEVDTGLRAEWDGLYADDPSATPFSTSSWAAAWLAAPEAQPYLVAAYEGPTLVGLAPLVLTRHGPFRLLRVLTEALLVNRLPPEATIGEALCRRAAGAATPAGPYPELVLPATFDSYLASLPGRRRSNLRHHMRHLDEDHPSRGAVSRFARGRAGRPRPGREGTRVGVPEWGGPGGLLREFRR